MGIYTRSIRGTGTAAAITLLDITGGSPPIDTGSPTGNALINIDPKVKGAFNNASQDPSDPDYDSASQQAGEDTLKDVFGWNEFLVVMVHSLILNEILKGYGATILTMP